MCKAMCDLEIIRGKRANTGHQRAHGAIIKRVYIYIYILSVSSSPQVRTILSIATVCDQICGSSRGNANTDTLEALLITPSTTSSDNTHAALPLGSIQSVSILSLWIFCSVNLPCPSSESCLASSTYLLASPLSTFRLSLGFSLQLMTFESNS